MLFESYGAAPLKNLQIGARLNGGEAFVFFALAEVKVVPR